MKIISANAIREEENYISRNFETCFISYLSLHIIRETDIAIFSHLYAIINRGMLVGIHEKIEQEINL